MKRLGGIVGLCLAVLGAAAAIAWAAPASITNDPASDHFLPTSFNHDAGTVATFVHSGASPHNVTSTQKGPDGKTLFSSATISSGSAPVNGTQYLAAGSYPFFCTVHGPSMSGTLIVSGTPQARPVVALKVLDKKLAKVLKKSQLRVKVTATGAGNVPIDVLLGKKAIANRTQLDAPGSTVLKIALTPKGRAALAKKKKATVTVKSSIDFGSPAQVSATLK
jgi:plastocyanin